MEEILKKLAKIEENLAYMNGMLEQLVLNQPVPGQKKIDALKIMAPLRAMLEQNPMLKDNPMFAQLFDVMDNLGGDN